MSETSAPRARLAHALPGRMRVRLHAPHGRGHLHRLATELERMPDTRAVRANHAARSVTVTFDPGAVSGWVLLTRVCTLGLVVLEPDDLAEWGELLAAELVPRAGDPGTVPGQLNQELLASSGGRIDLLRSITGLLLLMSGIEVGAALVHDRGIPWLRVLTYLLTAASVWSRRLGPAGVPGQCH